MNFTAYYNKLKQNPTVEETYRVLRSNIQFSGFNKILKSITIVSCYSGEGKTTTAVNLAISMASTGLKVLFIDADLRKANMLKPSITEELVGLSQLISGYASMDEVIKGTDITGFYYISSGIKPPNPAELVGSSQFADFLKEVSQLFDIIIIDTPPLGNVIDSAIISTLTDGTLIVIQPNKVDCMNAKRVKEQLEKANAKILGVVLNKVDCTDSNVYLYNSKKLKYKF